MLGQPVGGEDVRVDARAALPVARGAEIVRTRHGHAGRRALLAVDRVVDGRLLRLVVGRQRAVHQSARGVEPALAVRLHDERVDPRQRVGPGRAGRGTGVRGQSGREVGHVVARPSPGFRVPPDVLLAGAPRPPVGAGGGAVVEQPAVRGPHPRPVGVHPFLLGLGRTQRGMVHAVGEDPGVDPAAAVGGAVRAHLGVGRERLSGPLAGQEAAVDLGQHGRGVGVAVLVQRVLPGEVEQRTVARVRRPGEPLPDPAAQLVEEVQFALAVAGRLHRLVPPLHHPLGLGEGAGLLDVVGGGQEEDLGGDLFGAQLAGRDLRAVLPPGGRLDQREIPDHQPLQVRHAQPLHPAVGRADRRVLAQNEVAVDGAVHHAGDRLIGAVRAGQPGQVVVGPVVVGAGGVPPPGLQQAHRVGVRVGPIALLLG